MNHFEMSDALDAHYVRALNAANTHAIEHTLADMDAMHVAHFYANQIYDIEHREQIGRFIPPGSQWADDESTFAPTGYDLPELRTIINRHMRRGFDAVGRDESHFASVVVSARYLCQFTTEA
jgi:hypothetical protein